MELDYACGRFSSIHSRQRSVIATDVTRVPLPSAASATPLFIVLNAGSGRNNAASAGAAIRQVLEEAGRTFELLVVKNGDELARAVPEVLGLALKHDGAIVAAGGDGTLNCVADAALRHDLPFGALPQGTFNYFARTHGIALDAAAATRALLDSVVQPIQVGYLNDRPFLVNASVGLYPKLLEDREHYKHRFGRHRIVALWAGIATLVREHRYYLIRLEHEGKIEVVHASALFVGNNKLQLERLGLPQAAALDHDRLAAVTVAPANSLTMLGLMIRGAVGHLGDAPHIDAFTFQRLSVELRVSSRKLIKVAFDGEVARLPLPLVFRVSPRPLKLLLPAKPATAAAR